MKKYIDLSNRKFIRLLKQLNTEEITDFLNYLSITIQNTEDNELGLIRLLLKYAPSYSRIPIADLVKFFDKNEKKALSKINKPLYLMNRLLEKWLMYKLIDKDRLLQQQLLIQVYANYMTPKDFFKSQNGFQDLKLESEYGYPDYFYTQFKIESTILHYPHADRLVGKKLVSLNNHLDQFYVGQKLRVICQQVSRSKFMHEEVAIPMYDAVIAYAKQFSENPYYKLYLDLLELFDNHDDYLLTKIKEDFLLNHKMLTRLEQAIFLQMLINHVVLVMNTYQLNYQELRYEMFRLAEDKDLVLFNNGIADEYFYNVILSACKVNDFKFAKQFTKDYGLYLANGLDSVLIPFTNAFIAYHQGQFVKAEGFLSVIRFGKINFNLMHRLLRLKCLYELSDTSTFYYNFAVSNAQNFQKFLKPNRILSEEKKELYAVFIKFTLKLLRLKNKSARKRDNQKKKILSELEAPNFKSASKDWLVKKIKLL